MSFKFNADEVFQMAERIEKNGAKFYRKAAGFAEGDVSKTLLDLAIMEDSHIAVFAKMREELSDGDVGITTFDPDGLAQSYIEAMTDGVIFDTTIDPSEKITGSESTEMVFNIAIGLEKDSIVFYQIMKRVVPEKLGKDKLDEIIAEEVRHIALLRMASAYSG